MTNPTDTLHYSVSQQMYERFLRRRILRRFIAVCYLLLCGYYVTWRYGIINEDSLILSITYFAAEIVGFILGVTVILTSWKYNHHTPPPAPSGLTVDVLIPTYTEPLNIIRRTVMAAKSIDYPHQTMVLDDGKREEVKALAAELGVAYFSREKNTDAKAGNLNFGLQHSHAEFVMVMDADHIVLPHALDVMLGFFTDEQTALVQTPQDFYNIDSFQYMNRMKKGGGGSLWHDQSYFYNVSQPCRDYMEGATCVGTGVAYRRRHLDTIGGIPTTTVTEDLHTSLKLHKAGFKVVNLNEPIAYGVAAADLGEFYKTRHRWAHGNLHALAHENILFCKGLKFKQRLAYLSMGLIYLEGWQQLLLFLIPVGSLLFGLQPFDITVFNIMVVLFFPLLNYLILQEIGCGFSRFWANELFAMVRWPIHIWASIGLFGKHIKWRSSNKNIRGLIEWHLMAPQITIGLLSLIALTVGCYRLSQDFQVGPLYYMALYLVGGHDYDSTLLDIHAPMPEGYTIELVFIAGFWALYNAVRVLFFVMKSVNDAKRSNRKYRFNIPLPLLTKGKDPLYGVTHLLSESWVSLTLYGKTVDAKVGDKLSLIIHTTSKTLPVTLAIESLDFDSHDNCSITGHFIWENTADCDDLSACLYAVDWHREFLNRNAYFPTPSDSILACITFNHVRPHSHQHHDIWQAVLYKTPNNQTQYGVIGYDKHSTDKTLITFTTLPLHGAFTGKHMQHDNVTAVDFTIIGQEPISSLAPKSLDGSPIYRYKIQ